MTSRWRQTTISRVFVPFLLLAILWGQGCKKSKSPGQAKPPAQEKDALRKSTVIFDIDGGRVMNPDVWNPFVPGSRLDQGFHQAVIEPLFLLNYESGDLIPWLGTSFEHDRDLTTWTLRIRESIEWSDGEAFDADDVVFTVRMLLDNAPELLYSASLDTWIERVEKVDGLTVRFHLKKPNPRFQLDYWSVKIWGGPNIVPQHVWEGQDPTTFKNYDPAKGWPVFTGPYTLENANATEFVYVRNEDWWGAKSGWKPLPNPKRLVWTWYGPEETRAASMANGELDSLMDISYGAFQTLQMRNPRIIAWSKEPPYAWLDPCPRTLEVNHTVEPWDDKDMRWALNFAVNRDEIVRIAYENTTLASRHFFPAYPPLNRLVNLLDEAALYDKFPVMKHDPREAKRIIESKGYKLNRNGYYEKGGEELALLITTHEAFIEKQRIAQVLVEQFQAIGINATTRNEAGSTWQDNFQFGRFEARMAWHATGSINEPWSSMDTMSNRWIVPVGERAQYNGWRWDNQDYSDLVDRIGVLPLGDPSIDELFVQAMEIWLEELPVIPITQAKKLIPFDTSHWTGWPSKENNYIHSPTWWQSTHLILHHLEPAVR